MTGATVTPGAARIIVPEPLTRKAFTPFGDVIATDGAGHFPINQGTTERYHDLAAIDVGEGGGRPLINIFRGQPQPRPIVIQMMERHPLGSQAFVALDRRPYLVVVALSSLASPAPGDLRAFLADGTQGVNYRRGVWHHPLLALGEMSDFLVVDRGGPGNNLEEVTFAPDAGYAIIDV